MGSKAETYETKSIYLEFENDLEILFSKFNSLYIFESLCYIFSIADTFQALLQYSDAIAAQTAKVRPFVFADYYPSAEETSSFAD